MKRHQALGIMYLKVKCGEQMPDESFRASVALAVETLMAATFFVIVQLSQSGTFGKDTCNLLGKYLHFELE